MAIASDQQEARMEALDHLPKGARLVTLVGQSCSNFWPLYRNSHMPSMALVRRNAFANDQWAIEGANLLLVTYREAGYFRTDPSQMVRASSCRWPSRNALESSLRAFPREAFDYVWLIDPPPFDQAAAADLQLVWSGEGSRLYRVSREAGL